jgi:hypothetical protein
MVLYHRSWRLDKLGLNAFSSGRTTPGVRVIAMTDFFLNYVPERCDLVYGLATPRDSYLDAYVKWWLEDVYKDRFSGQSFGQSTPEKRKQTQKEIVTERTEKTKVNYYNKPITVGSFDDLNSVEFKNKLKSLEGEEYLRGLEKTRSAVAKIGAATYQSLSKGDSRLTEGQQLTERQLGDLRFFLAVGRACKYGIDYVLTRPAVQFKTATNVGMSEEHKLHYVLDEITSASIAGKQKFPLSAFDDKRPGTPITTSELRYLFRTWHTFKVLLGNRLFFYRNQNVTNPLWDQDPDQWIAYAQVRVAKLKDGEKIRYAKEISEFQSAVSSGKAQQALEKFFSMKTADPIKEGV